MSAPQPPDPSSKPPLPWVERSRIGLVTALIETCKLVVTDPREAFSRVRADGDYMGPFLFGLIIAWPAAVIGQLWSLLLNSVFTFGDQTTMGLGVIQVLIILVLYPLLYLLMVFIWAGLHHVSLMVLSALDRSPSGFEGTFKVLSYAMVTQVANLVPLIGPLIGLVAIIVLLVIGFEQAHQTSQGKAIGATLLPLALCCLCGIILAVAFGGAIAAAMAGSGASFQ